MEKFKQSPSQINSFQFMDVLKTVKKRKFQDEQLGLPTPKHKCWERNFPADEPVSMFDQNPEVQHIQTHAMKRKVEGVILDDGSEPESGEGSNSFAGYSDSATSVFDEAKLEPAHARTTCLYDRPSTSVNYINNSAEELKFVMAEHQPTHPDGEIQEFQNLEYQPQDFEIQADYICSEYGDDFTEQCTNKEFEDVLFSHSLNPNKYILSSGRWSVDQEVQSGSSRKPTIDQEFEQYFSMLML